MLKQSIGNRTSNKLYLLRFVAVIAVIICHSSFANGDNLILTRIVDSFANCGVVIFLFVSGFFAYKINPIKSLAKIVFPWLIWGAVTFVIAIIEGSQNLSILSFIHWIFGVGTYLWYVPIIILFNFLSKWIDGSKLWVLISLVVCSCIMRIITYFYQIPAVYSYLNPLNWLGYYCFGIIIRRYVKEFNLIWGILALVGIAICILADSLVECKLGYFGLTSFLSQYLWIVLLFCIVKYIPDIQLLMNVGSNSLVIYLTHIPVIGFLCNKLNAGIGLSLLLSVLIAFGLYLVFRLIETVAKRLKLTKLFYNLTGFRGTEMNRIKMDFFEKIMLVEGCRIPFFGGALSRRARRKVSKINVDELSLNTEPRETKVVCTLTTFPDRIDTVQNTIKTLFTQSLKPDRIVLWLAKEEFEGREFPESIKKLIDKGLEIKYCDNLFGHKRYYKIIEEQKDDEVVVMFDDDILFPKFLLERLFSKWQENKDCIICERGQVMTFNEDGIVNPGRWSSTSQIGINTPSYCILASPGGGCLLPPKALHKDANNVEIIKEHALKTDDIWLMFMAAENDTKIMRTHKNHRTFIQTEDVQTVQLGREAIYQGRYTKTFSELRELYPHAYNNMLASYKEYIENDK